LAGPHRRFEVVPGAQAQVDWGDEGSILAHVRVAKVYPFHMVLSYSRDPFCCFTTSMDIGTFFACHRRAFAHFGGVPGAIVYDRTKSVVRQHVGPWGCGAAASGGRGFVGHYNFDIDVLAAPPAGRHGQPAGLWRATQRRPHRDQHLPGR
jgi:transposase